MPEGQPFRDEMISLYKDAREMCIEMIAFKPDLIAATLESGWYLTLAAKALWEASLIPFPPIIRLNIGSDKVESFEQIDTPLRGILKSIHSLECRKHEYLAWLIDQKEWQSHLHKQIIDVIGTNQIPERILIVDSTRDRWTINLAEQNSDLITAIGLLDLIFPQARVRTFIGKSKCQVPLTYSWLNQFYPKAVPNLQNALNGLFCEVLDVQGKNQQTSFFSIASGIERGSVESMSFHPLTIDSPIIQEWKNYLPLESWLELPEWVEEIIPQEILRLASDPDTTIEPTTTLKSLSDEIIEAMSQNNQDSIEPALEIVKHHKDLYFDPPRTSSLHDENIHLRSKIMRDVYHDGRINSTQICNRYHVTRRKAQKHLEFCIQRNELYPQGSGRGRYYIASPEYTFFLENKLCLEDEVEILPEKLWLGMLPVDVPDAEDWYRYHHRHFYRLCNKGFTFLLKPSVQPEEDQRYDREMADFLEMERLPMKFHEYDLEGFVSGLWKGWVPRYEKIFQIVNDLEKILNENHKVYISMSEFGELIVYCLMAHRLGSIKEAADYLKDCRIKSVYYWRSYLIYTTYRSYVRRWMKKFYPEDQTRKSDLEPDLSGA